MGLQSIEFSGVSTKRKFEKTKIYSYNSYELKELLVMCKRLKLDNNNKKNELKLTINYIDEENMKKKFVKDSEKN